MLGLGHALGLSPHATRQSQSTDSAESRHLLGWGRAVGRGACACTGRAGAESLVLTIGREGGPTCTAVDTPGHSPGLLCSLPRTLQRFTHLSQPRRGSLSGCCLYLTELLQVRGAQFLRGAGMRIPGHGTLPGTVCVSLWQSKAVVNSATVKARPRRGNFVFNKK